MAMKIGDLVTWRSAPTKDSHEPLGIANCRIIEFGKAEDGAPAALIEVFGEKVGARVADLHPQEQAA